MDSELILYIYTSKFQDALTPDGENICDLLGINKDDMLVKTVELFKDKNTPQELTFLRATQYEERRRGKIKVIEKQLKNNQSYSTKVDLSTYRTGSPTSFPKMTKTAYGSGIPDGRRTSFQRSESPGSYSCNIQNRSMMSEYYEEKALDKEHTKQLKWLKVKSNQQKLAKEISNRYKTQLRNEVFHDVKHEHKKLCWLQDNMQRAKENSLFRATKRDKVVKTNQQIDDLTHQKEIEWTILREKMLKSKRMEEINRSYMDSKEYLSRIRSKIQTAQNSSHNRTKEKDEIDLGLERFENKLHKSVILSQIITEEKLKSYNKYHPQMRKVLETKKQLIANEEEQRNELLLHNYNKFTKIQNKKVVAQQIKNKRVVASYLHDQELIERIQLQLTKAIEEKNRDILEKSYDKHEVLLKNRDLIEQTRHIKIRQKERIKEKQRRNYKKVIENHQRFKQNVLNKHSVQSKQVLDQRERKSQLSDLQLKHFHELEQIEPRTKCPADLLPSHCIPQSVLGDYRISASLTSTPDPYKFKNMRIGSLSLTKDEKKELHKYLNLD